MARPQVSPSQLRGLALACALIPLAVDDQGIMARCGWSYWDSTHHRVESSPFIVIDSFEWL